MQRRPDTMLALLSLDFAALVGIHVVASCLNRLRVASSREYSGTVEAIPLWLQYVK